MNEKFIAIRWFDILYQQLFLIDFSVKMCVLYGNYVHILCALWFMWIIEIMLHICLRIRYCNWCNSFFGTNQIFRHSQPNINETLLLFCIHLIDNVRISLCKLLWTMPPLYGQSWNENSYIFGRRKEERSHWKDCCMFTGCSKCSSRWNQVFSAVNWDFCLFHFQIDAEDKLPKILCAQCLLQVETIAKFRETCINAQTMLESCLNSSKLRNGGKVRWYHQFHLKRSETGYLSLLVGYTYVLRSVRFVRMSAVCLALPQSYLFNERIQFLLKSSI